MTTALWLRDLAAFGLQLAVIIGAGAVIWYLLRVRGAVVTLAYWQVLLLACLLLPLCQPWRVSTRPSIERSTAPVVAEADAVALERPGVSATRAWRTVPMSDLLLLGLAAGAIGRGLWLMLGAYSLRRLRRSAVRLDAVPSFIREAQARIGARADVYISDHISGPITFGFKRPVIMLPPSVLSMDSELQEAIASHELLHVRRRDWLHVILEEIVRTVLWFHPAIWWLTDRIQLSREHVVDEAVIRLTQSRDRYVEALLAVALNGSHGALAPAPRFLRRRFLKRRVAHILQETAMTTRRLIASVTVSACALVLVAFFAVRSFPLEARTEQQNVRGGEPSTPIQILTGGEHLLHGALPEYPRRAIERRIEGDVVVDLTVDDRGEVSDARVISGPEELRRAALESVLQWHYSPEALRSAATQVSLRFSVPAAGAEIAYAYAENGRAVAVNKLTEKLVWEKVRDQATWAAAIERYARQRNEFEKALQDREATDWQKEELRRKLIETETAIERMRGSGIEQEERAARSEDKGRLAEIRTERVSPELAKEIADRAGISIGDPITEATTKRIREIVKSVDEHFRVSFERTEGGGVVLVILAP